MDNNFFDKLEVGEAIVQGLTETLEFLKGDKTKARRCVVSIPDPGYTGPEIAKLRNKIDVSQRGLSSIIGVSKRTVEAWEAGKSTPNGSAQRILYLIDKNPSIIEQLIK